MAALLCVISDTHALNANEAKGARLSLQQRVVKITPSPVLKMVRERLEREPRISDEELAAYANSQLAQHGYDYHFDVCEFIRTIPGKSTTATPSQYRFQMTQTDGNKLRLWIGGDAISDGMCGECFFAFPALRVTRGEILLLLSGKQYRLKRPRLFGLDEMSLVDATMKRVLRTWEVPQQSVPLGISADGTQLYLDTELDQLALEVAQGSVRFIARSRIDIRNGEDVAEHPKDAKNAYLAFMRFRSGQRSYIVRYSAPCT